MTVKVKYFFLFITTFIVYTHAAAQLHHFKRMKEYQLTFGKKGHTLNITQCFSPENEWLVYDTRNEGTEIGNTCCIEKVNIIDRSVIKMYRTTNQTDFGPGVGAAAYNPKQDKVIFIHGPANSNEAMPYGFTRRTGVIIDDSALFKPVYADARDIVPPFSPGALRGGSHAYSWSGDGTWLSFTYNDFIIEQLENTHPEVKDLRTVGVMAPVKKVKVNSDKAGENNEGEYFAVVVTQVKEMPVWGSDEIEKAFDECWIGIDGYTNASGVKQKKAIAFQGNIRSKNGDLITEVFVADLPENITLATPGKPLEGTVITRPNPPAGTLQRRVTHTINRKHPGIQGPRHWLRASPDGSMIYCLMKDDLGTTQVFSVPVNGGAIRQVTHNPFPVQSAFSISPDGRLVSYTADNSVFITHIGSGKTGRLTKKSSDDLKPEGGIVWSYDGKMIAYNRYVSVNNKRWLQVFVLK